MKNLNDCKSIRINDRLIFVNEKISMQTIKDACPVFFGNSRPNEKQTLFRGCVIIYRSSEKPEFRYRIYAFDVLRDQMVSISDHKSQINDAVDAKMFIEDAIAKSGDEPLAMITEVVQVVVPVTISMIVFRDLNGNRKSCEIGQVVQVGSDPERRIDPNDYMGAVKQIIENEAHAMVPNNSPLMPVLQSLK